MPALNCARQRKQAPRAGVYLRANRPPAVHSDQIKYEERRTGRQGRPACRPIARSAPAVAGRRGFSTFGSAAGRGPRSAVYRRTPVQPGVSGAEGRGRTETTVAIGARAIIRPYRVQLRRAPRRSRRTVPRARVWKKAATSCTKPRDRTRRGRAGSGAHRQRRRRLAFAKRIVKIAPSMLIAVVRA